MRLADHIIAAQRTMFDLGGIATSLSIPLQNAERFELQDDVVYACMDLLRSKPSSLLAALPLCRLPYPVMWFENRGGLAHTYPSEKKFESNRDPVFAPDPVKQGVLIQALTTDMQTGVATLAWMHRTSQFPLDERREAMVANTLARTGEKELAEFGVNVTPVSVYFDFRPEGDVKTLINVSHSTILKLLNYPPALKKYIQFWEQKYNQPYDSKVRSRFMKHRPGWEKFSHNPAEIEAAVKIDDHLMPGVSPHGANLIETMFQLAFARHKTDPSITDEAHRTLENWVLDTSGEGTFLLALIALLNSKNRIVQHEPVDLTKINKSRTKRGRSKFLSYATTRLVLNKTQQRVYDAGVKSGRITPGEHRVMGHFKIRKSGIYWWNFHMRGDPTRPVKRKEYEVEQ